MMSVDGSVGEQSFMDQIHFAAATPGNCGEHCTAHCTGAVGTRDHVDGLEF